MANNDSEWDNSIVDDNSISRALTVDEIKDSAITDDISGCGSVDGWTESVLTAGSEMLIIIDSLGVTNVGSAEEDTFEICVSLGKYELDDISEDEVEVETAPTLVDNSGIDDSLTIIESLGVTIEKEDALGSCVSLTNNESEVNESTTTDDSVTCVSMVVDDEVIAEDSWAIECSLEEYDSTSEDWAMVNSLADSRADSLEIIVLPLTEDSPIEDDSWLAEIWLETGISMDEVWTADDSELAKVIDELSFDEVSTGILTLEDKSVDIAVEVGAAIAVVKVGKIDVVVNQDPVLSVRILTTPVSVTVLPAVFVFVMVVVYSVGWVPGASGIGLHGIWQDLGKVLVGTWP